MRKRIIVQREQSPVGPKVKRKKEQRKKKELEIKDKQKSDRTSHHETGSFLSCCCFFAECFV